MVLPVSTSPFSSVSIPSRNSASAKAASRATSLCTSSRKLTVLAISHLLARPVVPPHRGRGLDVTLLPLLAASGEQDHQRLAVSPEIQPVTWPEIDPVLQHALSDRLHVRKIACFHSRDGGRHLRPCDRVQTAEPNGGRAMSVSRDEIADFEHPRE